MVVLSGTEVVLTVVILVSRNEVTSGTEVISETILVSRTEVIVTVILVSGNNFQEVYSSLLL